MRWHWNCLWPVPSEPSDCGLRLKSSRKESWPFPPHSSSFRAVCRRVTPGSPAAAPRGVPAGREPFSAGPLPALQAPGARSTKTTKKSANPTVRGPSGGAIGGHPGWGLWGEEAADIDRGGLSPVTSSLIACRFSLGSTFRAKRANQAREILSSWERERVEISSSGNRRHRGQAGEGPWGRSTGQGHSSSVLALLGRVRAMHGLWGPHLPHV